ncbi:hypothetical protein Aduo_005222 [Ancylostoma duodenale]
MLGDRIEKFSGTGERTFKEFLDDYTNLIAHLEGDSHPDFSRTLERVLDNNALSLGIRHTRHTPLLRTYHLLRTLTMDSHRFNQDQVQE